MKLLFALLEDDKTLLAFYKFGIEEILSYHNIQGEVVYTSNNPEEFLNFMKTCAANVCIMDINLKTDTNGMHIAKEIRRMKIPAEIIFITGHLQYMKNAFQVRAFDYLEKPVTTEELEKCILRLQREINVEQVTQQEVFIIKSGTSIYHLPIDDIYYVERCGTRTVIVTRERRIETYDSLTTVSKMLPQEAFKQCHKSIWVNVGLIDRIDLKREVIILKSGTECDLGKTYRKEFSNYAV